MEPKFDWNWYDKAVRKYCIDSDIAYTNLLKQYDIHPYSIAYQKMRNPQTLSDKMKEKIKKLKWVDYKKFMWEKIPVNEYIDLPDNAMDYMSKWMYYVYKSKWWKIKKSIREKYLSNKLNKWKLKQ